MKRLLLAAAVAFSTLAGAASAQMSLDTGYNYQTYAPYNQPAGGTSTIADNYWIKVASPNNPGSWPAWVLPATPAPPWSPVSPTSRWIGPGPVALSPAAQLPTYAIFRKCFCLKPNFKQPTLNFRIRADDNVQVWFNGILNVLVAPVVGNWNNSMGPPRSNTPTNPAMFKAGVNCLYVLVEETGGHTGFNLSGTVSAQGLWPNAASGVNSTFDCPCVTGGPVGPASGVSQGRAANGAEFDDRELIQSIVRVAEQRRLARPARQ
ncbi:hypothetical protein [Brevundimonas sp. TWP2-3-4b2]|uniref:hypothetical protein n=1 Tax=Brevundimonas sp. TWP2-3-4b2 TaxID=2804595 RepID=UPI003CEB0C73